MAPRTASPNARRLRWALLVALALHAALFVRYAPALFERFEVARRAIVNVPASTAEEEIVEITPPALAPKSRGMTLATTLGAGSPEQLPAELPAGFFDRLPAPRSEGLQLSGDFDFSRASGVQIVARIVASSVPAAVVAAARSTQPKPARERARAVPAPRATADEADFDAGAAVAAPQPDEPATPAFAESIVEPETPVPFLLPPPVPSYDVDAAISRAARAADETARAANADAAAARAAPDYRALLPQGALVAAPPLPLGGNRAPPPSAPAGSSANTESGITTFALDAASAARSNLPPLAETRAGGIARQQFFAVLTARLKATNVRLLAEAVRAGPRVTVRMRFLLDREGRVLEVSASEPVDRVLASRAAAVIRAAVLPRVPEAMAVVPVELSFPVEVYR